MVLAVATLAAVIVRMVVTFRENIELLDSSRREALTDALTGLRNRRALMGDLEDAAAGARVEAPVALVILDLDGFKQYNDRFGHPMGDALLVRLARKLEVAAGRFDTRVYRHGGDEFVVLAAVHHGRAVEIATAAQSALSEEGEASPSRAPTLRRHTGRRPDAANALRIADSRLYARKDSRQRSSVGSQTSAALLQALKEREPELRDHLDEVAQLSVRIGQELGLTGQELADLVRLLTCMTSARWLCRTRSCRSPAT